MARAIWTGVISFGLVSVPVGLYSATEGHEVSFHQFEEGTEDRIRYQRVNERTGEEVEYGDIVKGADTGGGHHVMVEPDELESVAPGRSRSLEIDTFVDLADIDPMHFQKSYYLGPRGDDAKAYALLRDAMAKDGKAAIASFVMRGKEYLAAVRADAQVLVLQTLFFADEIRDPAKEVDDLPGVVKASSKELAMARQLIDTMSGPWEPESYHDSYTERVKELIAAKDDGQEIDTSEDAPEATNVVDLVSALRASVDAANQRRSGTAKKSTGAKSEPKKSTGAKSAPRKSTARKSTAKKSTTKKSTTKKSTTKKQQPTKKAS